MPSVVYPDKSVSSIVSQLKLNNVKVDSETNAIFNFLKIFFFYSVHHHKTSLINFIKNAAISAKNLMNYQ